MDVYQWRRQFFRRHGGYEAAIQELDRNGDASGFLVFPDGARCESWQERACEEPPANEMKRLKRVIRYHEVIVQRVEHTFSDLKRKIAALHEEGEYFGLIQYETQDGLNLNDKPDAIRALKRAKATVVEKRRELAECRQQLQHPTAPSSTELKQQRIASKHIEQQEQRFRDELKRTAI